MTVPEQAVEAAGWEVEGFIDRLTRRDDSNSERLVLEAIRHLRAFSRDCDGLRESNARLTQERDHAIENERREREEHDELRAEHLREIERLRLLVGVEREGVAREKLNFLIEEIIDREGREGLTDQEFAEQVIALAQRTREEMADAVLALLPKHRGQPVEGRAKIAKLADVMGKRASGFAARGATIFNGEIIAGELQRWADRLAALSPAPASPQPREEGEWQKISDKLADALRHFNAVIADEGGVVSRKAMLTRQMASDALDAYLALVAEKLQPETKP